MTILGRCSFGEPMVWERWAGLADHQYGLRCPLQLTPINRSTRQIAPGSPCGNAGGGLRPRQDTQNMGNWKTPGHRGGVFDSMMLLRIRAGYPLPQVWAIEIMLRMFRGTVDSEVGPRAPCRSSPVRCLVSASPRCVASSRTGPCRWHRSRRTRQGFSPASASWGPASRG